MYASFGVITPITGLIEILPHLPDFWRNFRDPFRAVLRLKTKLDEEDFEFITELRDSYNIEVLNFVAKRLPSRAGYVRDNYGMMIGTPSQLKIFLVFSSAVQVGLVPYFQTFIKTHTFLIIVFVCMLLLFLVLAVVDQHATQRMEELAQLLELAANQKDVKDRSAEAASVTAS